MNNLDDYSCLSLENQRLWRFKHLPKMTQGQIIEFYECCIQPLEIDSDIKEQIYLELKQDMPKAIQLKKDSDQELIDSSVQKEQMQKYNKDKRIQIQKLQQQQNYEVDQQRIQLLKEQDAEDELNL